MLNVKLTNQEHHSKNDYLIRLLDNAINAVVNEYEYKGQTGYNYELKCKNLGVPIYSFDGSKGALFVDQNSEFILKMTHNFYNQFAPFVRGQEIKITPLFDDVWKYDFDVVKSEVPSNGTAPPEKSEPETKQDTYASFQSDRDAYWEKKEANKTADIHRQVVMKEVAPTMPVKPKWTLDDYKEMARRFWITLGIMEGHITTADMKDASEYDLKIAVGTLMTMHGRDPDTSQWEAEMEKRIKARMEKQMGEKLPF